jgi:RNA polymerase sigma factor (sigma-70 family)
MVDYWRQRQRERSAPEDRAIATTSDPDVPLRVDMARTFGQLKPQQRQLLWMAYVEGADHREIATALGLRERSVRVLLHRARHKLARLLQQELKESANLEAKRDLRS